MNPERYGENRDFVQVSVSVASGIGGFFLAEYLRVSNSANEIAQQYDDLGIVSRVAVVVIAALSAYGVFEENFPRTEEE